MQDLTQFFGKYFTKNEGKGGNTTNKRRIEYLKCNRDAVHEEQVMNYVCVERTCADRGLMCSFCKNAHANHPIVSLKDLILQLEESLAKDVPNPSPHISSLQDIFQKIIGNLTSVVETMAEEIRSFQAKIRLHFSQTKAKILRQYETRMKLSSTIDAIFTCDSKVDIPEQVIEIVDNCHYNRTRSKYTFDNNPQQFVNALKNKQQKLEHLMFELGNSFKKQLKQMNFVTDTQIKIEPSTAFKFSQNFKGKSISLSESNLQAKQAESNNTDSRFAIIEPSLPLNCKTKITFKVTNLANWVGVGICAKDVICGKKYKFTYESLGHGSFLMSSNGYIWSSSDNSDNIKLKGFPFTMENSIVVEFDPENKKLIYSSEDGKNKFEQNINLTGLNGPINFCANLCSKNDQVRIC